MAREKDEAKRQAILAAAKRLFAERGYHATSVSDLARETELPVGSIYTYFENKDDVVRTVIEEGWELFFQDLMAALDEAEGPTEKLRIVLDRFLPSLFKDIDLISLILSEVGKLPGLEEKLERLAEVFRVIVVDMGAAGGRAFDFSSSQARAAIILFLLGSLDSVRLARDCGLSVSPEDLLLFIRLSVENAFGVSLGPPDEAIAALRS